MSLAYAWDEPSVQPRLLDVQLTGGDIIELSLDSLKHYPPFRVSMQVLDVEVYAEGPTKVLCVRHLSKAKRGKPVRERVQTARERDVQQPAPVSLQVQVILGGIGVSVVDDTPEELMYLCIEGIHLDYRSSADESALEVRQCAISLVSWSSRLTMFGSFLSTGFRWTINCTSLPSR